MVTASFGVVYSIWDVGFPVPVPGSGQITTEQMAKLNPPSQVGDCLLYSGMAIFWAAVFLLGFQWCCSFLQRMKSKNSPQ
jgi:hypothetical protein